MLQLGIGGGSRLCKYKLMSLNGPEVSGLVKSMTSDRRVFQNDVMIIKTNKFNKRYILKIV